MKKLLACCLLAIIASPLFSQTQPTNSAGEESQAPAAQLTVERQGGENRFFMNGRRIGQNDVKNLMAGNDAASREFRRARTNYVFAMAFAATGGALIGWPIGTAMGGGKPEWAMLGAGAALAGVSFVFQSGYNKRSQKAVEIFNGNSSYANSGRDVALSLAFTGNGLGMRLLF